MLMSGMKRLMTVIGAAGLAFGARAAEHPPAETVFKTTIQPIIESYCYDCHADGEDKGGVAFDRLQGQQPSSDNRELWLRVLKNLRAGLMPPHKKAQPTVEEKNQILGWIKNDVFRIDPMNPDPGRVTIRRLNRVEYRNTIRDLTGVNFDTADAFPPDDTGHGVDHISDVLTLPTMLLEKYLIAAEKIVAEAVPLVSIVPVRQVISGHQFRGANESERPNRRDQGSLPLSFYSAAAVSNTFTATHDGQYQVELNLRVNERYVDNLLDRNRCRLIFRMDGKELLRQEFSWQGGKPYRFEFDQDWRAGDHCLELEVHPLTTNEPQNRSLTIQVNSVAVRGPMAEEHWVRPEDHERFFAKPIPETLDGRRAYAREMLGDFARRAFRRPVDRDTEDRLVALAEGIFTQPGKSFEMGIAQGMKAVLASPRFLFREEGIRPDGDHRGHALVDEYALASRLSYFFWSSMPDAELFRLAGEGTLRRNMSAQVDRMLKDRRSEALIKNFTGQWLHARDIETVPIDARAVVAREDKPDPERERTRRRFRELNNRRDEQLSEPEREELASIRASLRAGRLPPRMELNSELRRAMRQETERYFDHVIREDRSLMELIDSDYTFLNETLARHYGITNVSGSELRRVGLPPDSPRGGILGQGTILAVTSNPTRTSPVKRGVFILENILGTPPPPPPPDIPPLDEADRQSTNRAPLLREALAIHRENVLCSSCHNRMDPLGLAMENFNAMGAWRDSEFEQPIEASGKLVTGAEFKDFRELKRILAEKHSTDFYRTITEKLLTYALGRGLEYYDVPAVDEIVARLEESGGRPSALLMGIVESAAFQKTRSGPVRTAAAEPARTPSGNSTDGTQPLALVVNQEGK
jgi:hypothetical protein